MSRLILASKSAARAAMLKAAGVPFEVRGSGVDEAALKAALQERSPHEVAERLAEAKALAVSVSEGSWVIGADQTLELDGALIDKPGSRDEARGRLLSLRGRAHRLHSAAVLARGGEVVWREAPTCTLQVRAFSDAWLDDYLARAGDAVLGSVGAYQLEGLGVQLFERVEGDWFSILGLPLLGLLEALRRERVIAA